MLSPFITSGTRERRAQLGRHLWIGYGITVITVTNTEIGGLVTVPGKEDSDWWAVFSMTEMTRKTEIGGLVTASSNDLRRLTEYSHRVIIIMLMDRIAVTSLWQSEVALRHATIDTHTVIQLITVTDRQIGNRRRWGSVDVLFTVFTLWCSARTRFMIFTRM
ncbi:hypothetical protein BaRGS_00029840 [Batillaria attramentaria]|uniref:Uncharacterized protein n=1 Tax=Batillaria attramentaria TaxID=370345 RepID=A0ABD0JVW0_9CAEN